MSAVADAEKTLQAGDPAGALIQLQEQVRANPADAKLRIFLFQLLCVLGQWQRALTQLAVVSDLDPAAAAMAQMYGEAIRCEAIRTEVFEGKRAPLILGTPDAWVALLVESLLRAGQGDDAQAEDLRQRAFEEASPSSGRLDGTAFEWIADADSRLGPVLEAIVNGRYYWVPFTRLAEVTIDRPADLRDLVWTPAVLRFTGGGESVALIPTRYAGSERSADGAILMARRTIWQEVRDGVHHGSGQRIISTDAGDTALMEITTIAIDAQEAAGG